MQPLFVTLWLAAGMPIRNANSVSNCIFVWMLSPNSSQQLVVFDKDYSNDSKFCLHFCCIFAEHNYVIAPDTLVDLLQSLVDIIKHGLTDENQKVKTITSLSIAALAEAAAPYGIESFDDVLEPLWKGIRLLRYGAVPLQSILLLLHAPVPCK